MGKADHATKGGKAANIKQVKMARKIARLHLMRSPQHRKLLYSGDDEEDKEDPPVVLKDILQDSNLASSF